MSVANLKLFLIANKLTLGLVLGLLILAIGGFSLYKNFTSAPKPAVSQEDITLNFDPEGPFALLIPRKDGNAVNLIIKRIASYNAFAYTISYTDEQGIDRGAGNEDTWINLTDKKSEYEQEILFGTCSKNVCKYDQGVENGTVVLRIKKENQVYRMVSQWHLQKPDLALGNLSSGDNHFIYKTDPAKSDLKLLDFTLINDLTGAPKLPNGKEVLGKVYALNAALTRQLPAGQVTIELAENPPAGSKIARYDEPQNKWIEYETKITGSKLEATADGSGVFAVLTDKK